MSVDIKLRESSHGPTPRNKSNGEHSDITEENDEDSAFRGSFEDQEAMKSKLPSSFED